MRRLPDYVMMSSCLIAAFLQEALKALWNAAFPGEELRGLISEQWKEMGWQGKDPSTDFRWTIGSFVNSMMLFSAIPTIIALLCL